MWMNRRQDRISARQLGALAVTAAGLPIFRVCCRLSWNWVLLGGVAASLTLSALTAWAQRQRSRQKQPGPWIVILLPLFLSAALLTAWESGYAFPETAGSWLAAALVFGLSVAAVRIGPAAAGRCAGILLWITGALYSIILLFSLPQIRFEWLKPTGTYTDALQVWGALLLPGAALCLAPALGEDQNLPQWPWWFVTALAAAASIITGGILSPVLAREAEAFRTLARGVSVLGVIRRFGALVNGAMLISGFSLCVVLLAAAETVCLPIKKYYKKFEKSVDKRSPWC